VLVISYFISNDKEAITDKKSQMVEYEDFPMITGQFCIVH
jgi:hypothetical protein